MNSIRILKSVNRRAKDLSLKIRSIACAGKMALTGALMVSACSSFASPIQNAKPNPEKEKLVYRSEPVVDTRPYFDIPVTYNSKVKFWINYFQTSGKKWFRTWLERSHAYMPVMQNMLANRNMPQDLAYVAMIESGFSAHATSDAAAVGYWQFIAPTANRYGLKTNWWLDERRDFSKSTSAAARYLADLYKMFGSWYLTAAAYNMGEGKMKRLINRHQTKNYWILSNKPDFPNETRDYIPKLLAAMLIAKAPALYGFNDIKPKQPYSYEYFHIPGGTDLYSLAAYCNVSGDQLTKLNPELVKGYVPSHIPSHRIRIPRGLTPTVSRFVRANL